MLKSGESKRRMGWRFGMGMGGWVDVSFLEIVGMKRWIIVEVEV
jgi:hypothetical protein